VTYPVGKSCNVRELKIVRQENVLWKTVGKLPVRLMITGKPLMFAKTVSSTSSKVKILFSAKGKYRPS
jgi:hypothetical protein